MNRLLCMISWLVLAMTVVLPGRAGAQDTTTFFIETFDGVTPPNLPAGWSDPNQDWETNASVSSTGSGLNNLRIAGATGGTVQSALIDLSGMTSGTLHYLARRTSSYELDSLIVRASVNGGVTFAYTLLDMGQALPVVDGAYELISVPLPAELIGVADVQIQFEALGGSTSGANIRIDDVEITGTGEPPPVTNQLGFVADSSNATGSVFEVPLVLDFANTEALQGIQLDITWEAGLLSLTDVIRSAAIADTSGWQINFDSRDGTLRVVLLGEPATALLSGSYDPFVTLQFTVDAANTANSATLTIARVLGALSVRTGDDAGLSIGTATHTVTLASGTPVFTPDATTVDFGFTDIETPGTSVLTVTNSGDADLVISAVASSNALFDVTPAAATVTAGSSEEFSVVFTPQFENFGYQASDLTFTHNAAGSSDIISLVGIGTGGRGDMSTDGLVDVSDLVLGIDYVLETLIPAAGPFASADVYPFALPDSLLDVRDLTVLSQAIVIGSWPDETALPAPSPAAGKVDYSDTPVKLREAQAGQESRLFLELSVPVRAFQLSLRSTDPDALQWLSIHMLDAGVTPLFHLDAETGIVNILGAHMTGGVIPAGDYQLLAWDVASGGPELQHGLAIAQNGDRLPVVLATEAEVSVEDDVLKSALSLDQVFPNPYVNQNGGSLNIPFSLGHSQHVEIEVFDILGRKVRTLMGHALEAGRHTITWNGKDTQNVPAAPGLYLIRIKTSTDELTRTFMVR